MMADILKFTDSPIIDESIEEYEYHEYEPITGTSLNNGDDIRISIESQDVFAHHSESYLIFITNVPNIANNCHNCLQYC